jgi:hypothetical protein
LAQSTTILSPSRRIHGVDIAAPRVLDPAGATDVLGRGEREVLADQRLDRELVLVRELEAIGAEQLDAVVLIRVMAGRDHHADVGAQLAGQQRHGRGRHRPQQHDVHTDAGEARDHRVLQHVARQASVLADHHAVAVRPAQETRARRLADFHRGRRGHYAAIGASPNAVGAEELSSHGASSCVGALLALRKCYVVWDGQCHAGAEGVLNE